MSSSHHDLQNEFPEFRELIHNLKESDTHFRALTEKYSEVAKAVYRTEQRIDLMSLEDEEKLRMERMSLKDEIYSLLRKANKA